MVLVSAWIVRHAGGHAEGDTARAERWLRLPTSQQAPWLRATYGQLADCELEAIRLPWE